MSEINITLNGQLLLVPAKASLLEVLTSQQIDSDSIALVRDGQVVPKSLWAITECEANDCIELFGVVAGG